MEESSTTHRRMPSHCTATVRSISTAHALGLSVAAPLFFSLFFVLLGHPVLAQCFGTVQFPAALSTPNWDGDTAIISPNTWAGDYALVYLDAYRRYRFTSSVASDHITISTAQGAGVEVFGMQPLSYTPTVSQAVFVHFHTGSACGTEQVDRETRITRMHCLSDDIQCGPDDPGITRVIVDTLNNPSSACGDSGYSDFTDQVADIVVGTPLPIAVNTIGQVTIVIVRVDRNRDLDFFDDAEELILSSTNGINWTGTITAPAEIAGGSTVLRVVSRSGSGSFECDGDFMGSVEDYTLNVINNSAYRFAGGDGRGDAQHTFTSTIVDLPFTGGRGRGDRSLTFNAQVPVETFLAARVMLEGPYNTSTGLMEDALRWYPSFPLSEPYTALGYTHVGGGEETVDPLVLSNTGDKAIVDWVVLELRNAAVPATVVATHSALLQRDGDIVAMDGTSPVGFSVPPGNYNVAVRHRNHLGTMTLNAVSLSPAPVVLDLTSAATTTFGSNARKSISGTFPTLALWAGDVNFDGTIKYTGASNDRDPILQTIGGGVPTATVTGYHGSDVNMDGTVKYTGTANDRDPVLQNIGGGVPTGVRVEQVP